jgi:hypothetical protein
MGLQFCNFFHIESFANEDDRFCNLYSITRRFKTYKIASTQIGNMACYNVLWTWIKGCWMTILRIRWPHTQLNRPQLMMLEKILALAVVFPFSRHSASLQWCCVLDLGTMRHFFWPILGLGFDKVMAIWQPTLCLLLGSYVPMPSFYF